MNAELNEDEAIARVAERLRSTYPSVDPRVVDEAVTEARGHLGSARIRTFVPIFVEREARAALTATGRVAPA
jgi:hypothetical protein